MPAPTFQNCLEGLLVFWRECRGLDYITQHVKETIESSTPARVIPGLNYLKARRINVEEDGIISITSPGMLRLNFPVEGSDGIVPCMDDGTPINPLSLEDNYLKQGMIPVVAGDKYKTSISTVDTGTVVFIPYKDIVY